MVRIPIGQKLFAVIDDSDRELAMKRRWYVRHVGPGGKNYVFAQNKNGYQVSLHRFLLNAPRGLEVDHINGDGLDNRRENLRLCDTAGNRQNTNGWTSKRKTHTRETPSFKGVWKVKKLTGRLGGRIWEAKICYGAKQRYIGSFFTAEEAALAYDAQARIHHKQFARFNFPRPGERGLYENP